MNAPIIELSGVTFAYGRRAVLHQISLAVAAGEFVGLLGPNGSGKSTLLKLLYGHLQPETGMVQLNGADLRKLTPRQVARSVAVVPQDVTDTFGFTVAERVLMGRHPFLGPFDFETEHDLSIAREAMRLTDTTQFAGRTLSEISGGERQRVGIARALATDPKVLICDEPIASLDVSVGAQILELLRELSQQRRLALLFISHDLRAVACLCTRVSVMRRGRFLETAPTDTLLSHPRHPYTQLLIRCASLDLDAVDTLPE